MEIYNKQPFTPTKHLELLKSRGLIIDNENDVLQTLSTISYYRLSAYMIPFKQRENGKVKDEFREGTTWQMIIDLYTFDRKLRLLVFDTIEKIEIALRAQIVQTLSNKYGSHWQDKPEIFKIETKKIRPKKKGDKKNSVKKEIVIDIYLKLQEHIKDRMLNTHAEIFLKHYKEKYDYPLNPPSWMCSEIMYFRQLFDICTHLKDRSDLTLIASFFDIPTNIFPSWLHTINYIRNVCAHHARLMNRNIDIIPEKLRSSNKNIWISNPQTVNSQRLYYSLCIINYFLQTIDPKHPFKDRLKELLKQYDSVISHSAMGFPQNWQDENIWNS